MIVGDTCVGKTTLLEVMKRSISSLAGLESYVVINAQYMNPKSVIQKHLYGIYDDRTNEFSPGIIPKIIKRWVDEENENCLNWMILDGPVDADWIEDMNSVLDDNKKLCLASGDSIKLKDNMRIIFEVQELTQASPATILRCGMI